MFFKGAAERCHALVTGLNCNLIDSLHANASFRHATFIRHLTSLTQGGPLHIRNAGQQGFDHLSFTCFALEDAVRFPAEANHHFARRQMHRLTSLRLEETL